MSALGILRIRSLWMGPGQDPYAIEIETDEG